jgi:class 3 adenylate cyclase
MSAPAREVRKTVTILFCDLVHSTGLAEGDPEAYRRVQTRFFDRMRAIVEAHGGTVEKFIGDEVMAVFGIPTVHEDDALRAVRAAQEMQDALPELGLEARIGINTGEVLAGDPTHGLGLVAGEPVIVAKRLEQGADAGEIVIGKSTYPLVKHAVTAGPLERISVKGKQQDVGRRRVDVVDREAPNLARRLDLPLVGRTDELGLLEHAFERTVQERSCRLFTVLGPPGIGKSRLAGELASVLGERATTAIGRCLPYGEGITFWPLAEIRETLGDLTEALGDDAGPVLQLLDSLTGTAETTASSEEAFWAVRRALESSARRRPLVVCIEDLHWAEPTLLDLVEYLVGWSRDAPILLVCLARPELVERRPTLIAPRSNADALALEPLSTEQTTALLDGLSAEHDPPERERIGLAAEGKQLFVEQMADMAPENGHGELEIPPSIHALLAERLDRLTHEERRVI